jgi:proteasome alpha subunit
MTEEPYRWLEAIRNRREYIEDQLQTGQPVVVVQGEPGILLMTLRAGTPKLFEIYDRLALGCVGHPADLEKVRQAAIDTAHVEGFTRSAADVTSRRLVNYSLGPALKNAFEQIFSAPLMFRGVLAEIGQEPKGDLVWLLDYDGSYFASSEAELAIGILVAGRRRIQQDWSAQKEKAPAHFSDWKAMALHALRLLVWARQPGDAQDRKAWADIPAEAKALVDLLAGAPLEAVVLDRSRLAAGGAYRVPNNGELGFSG